ncbi:MAG TPA: ribonuclease HII [Limnochordales bacterium]
MPGPDAILVAGVDEAGRGPLAGPVVAAAVILGDAVPPGVTDSKLLTPARRAALYQEIVQSAVAVAYKVVSPRRIDSRNILRASLAAMREAVLALPVAPDQVVVDGPWPVPGLPLPQRSIVDGDRLHAAVAAASIVAKVVRDRIMTMWDRVYPEYGFADHKGYGTRQHRAVLARLGPCPLHRLSFAPVVASRHSKALQTELPLPAEG